MKKIIKTTLPSFLPIALAVTLTFLTFYVAIQQNYRMNANDPQIQLAEDISSQLANGAPYQYFMPNVKIDISKSLGTFLIIYDNNGKLLGSSMVLNGKQPNIPTGVFSNTKNKGETRFTWQPEKNVRSAVVVVHYKNGFVIVGKSLKEVEIRIDNLTKIVFLGWIFTLASVFALLYLLKNK